MSRVVYGRVIARIVLADGSEISIKNKYTGEINEINSIRGLSISKSLSANSSFPIGVPCSASGSLTIKTKDKSLMPDNANSAHFGKMDNTAVIYLTIEFKEDGVDYSLAFGTYFVDNWYSRQSLNKNDEAIIEFTGIMSMLNKSSVPAQNIEKNVRFKSYLVDLVSKWNETVEDKYKIVVNENKLNFGPFETMLYSDIDASNIGEAFIILSQSTLTNLYISEENELLTDFCFDDSASESLTELSDYDNITSFDIGDGLLAKYKGVKVNYPNIIVNDSTVVSSLNSQTVVASSETEINNIDTGGKLFKLNAVKVSCKSGDYISIADMSYNKKQVNLKLSNTNTVDETVDIEIIGQTLNSSKLSLSEGSEPILEVTNNLLSSKDIRTYLNNIVTVINNKKNGIKVTGHFTPRIKLGSIVTVTLNTLGKTGVYKVHAINFEMGSTFKTTLTLYPIIEA